MKYGIKFISQTSLLITHGRADEVLTKRGYEVWLINRLKNEKPNIANAVLFDNLNAAYTYYDDKIPNSRKYIIEEYP